MSTAVSAIPTSSTRAVEGLRAALAKVPKLNGAAVEKSLKGGDPLKLTAKQATLVVAHLNRYLKSEGFAPITPKELIGASLKPIGSGCLNPCTGATTSHLLGILASRFK